MKNVYCIAVMSRRGSVERWVCCSGTSKLRALRSRDDARRLRSELASSLELEDGQTLKVVKFCQE